MSILVEPARIVTVTLPDLIADYDTGNPVVVGDAVYVESNNLVAPARADSLLTIGAGAIGIVVEIVSLAPPICKVRRLGEAEVFSGLTPGATYWVSASVAGAITVTPPGFPSILNEIGIAITPKKLAIEPTRLIIKN